MSRADGAPTSAPVQGQLAVVYKHRFVLACVHTRCKASRSGGHPGAETSHPSVGRQALLQLPTVVPSKKGSRAQPGVCAHSTGLPALSADKPLCTYGACPGQPARSCMPNQRTYCHLVPSKISAGGDRRAQIRSAHLCTGTFVLLRPWWLLKQLRLHCPRFFYCSWSFQGSPAWGVHISRAKVARTTRCSKPFSPHSVPCITRFTTTSRRAHTKQMFRDLASDPGVV